MSPLLYKVLQVVLACVVFVVLNNFAVWVLKREDVIEDPTKLRSVPIFKGWVETNGFTNKKYDTYNMFSKAYRKLSPSMNKKGGAQFTYTVWVKLNDFAAENTSRKVLFMHGDDNMYNYTINYDNKKETFNDYIVKCPLVKFGDSTDQLIVEFNTSNEITQKAVISKVPNTNEAIRSNVFSLMPGRWVMMTFVFEDDIKYDEPESGVLFKFYLNDILHHTQRFTGGALRLNKGKLHILPSGPIKDGFMADLTYHNFAFNADEVRKVFAQGVSNTRYNEMESDPEFNQPMYLTQYNKLNIHNM